MELLESGCRSCEFWSGMLISVQQCVLITDSEGRVLFANKAAGKTFGCSLSEMQGLHLSQFITPEDIEHLFPNLLYIAQKGNTFRGEIMLTRKDESRFIAHLSLQPHVEPKSGETLFFLCIEDIQKQKEMERRFTRSYYPDLIKIAEGIAHEIRNPLVGIGGFGQRLFKVCSNDPDTHTYFEHMMRNVKKIENLIQKVEFFAKLPKPMMEKTVLSDVVGNVVEGCRAKLEARTITVSLEVENVELCIDRDLIARALSIFIENAMDAISAGGNIKVGAAVDEDQAIIFVLDNGKGISEEDLPYIFNPFFSTKSDGAGIDLAIVKRIAESHGGTVDVKSALHEGTTFFLKLPIEKRRTIRSYRLEEQKTGGMTQTPFGD
ncbi:MAG: nitrogen regulation protein NR(II) [Syntrophobacteraceae bacterium]